ncbi:MAG: hypothetical protein ACK47Q_02245 [Dolichospermum sp.]|jgi:hypothetical protein
MTKQQGFLATFRIDEDLWGKFKDIAKTNRTNASALIVAYIEGVVSAGEVADFGIAGQGTDSLSIQNIDKLIGERIKSVQDIDSLSIQQIDLRIDERIKSLQQSTNSLSVQDIDKRIDEKLGGIESMVKKLIGENIPVIPDEWELSQLVRTEIGNSLEEGHIAGKIQDIRDYIVRQFNEMAVDLNSRLAKVEGAVTGENKPDSTTTKPELVAPVDNLTTSADKTKLINLLGLEKILSGDLYNADTLKKDGYFKAIADNKAEIAKISGIEVKLADDLTDMNAIINWLGYKSIRTTHKKISYRKVTGKHE